METGGSADPEAGEGEDCSPACGLLKESDVLAAALVERLEALLQKIEQLRSAFYPPGWRYDPLYQIARELRLIISQLNTK